MSRPGWAGRPLCRRGGPAPRKAAAAPDDAVVGPGLGAGSGEAGINFRQLTYFRKVVDAGNITQAAERLHLAQPALGAQIRQLEQELGVALIRRHSRGVTPTPAGMLLYRHAQKLLDDLDLAAREVRAMSGAGQEQLRLGVSPSMVLILGPDAMLDAGSTLPDVVISLVEERTAVLLDAIERNHVDIAFLNNAEDQPWLDRTALLEEDLLLITAPWLAPEGETVGFAEALSFDLALGGRRSVLRRILETEAKRLSMQLRVAYEVHSLSSMKTMVARGSVATIMPYGVVSKELRSGKVVGRRILRPALTRTLYMVRRRDRPAFLDTPQVRAHVDKLVDAYLARVTPWARRLY